MTTIAQEIGRMELKKISSPLIILHEIATAMNSTLDPDKLLDLILDRSIQFCNVDSGSLMLINHKEEVLDIITSRGLNPKVREEVKLKIGQGVTGMVARIGKGKLINDVTKDQYYIEIKKEIKSELAVPMIVEEEIIGVISLDSNRVDAFTEEHLEIVSLLANEAAQIFRNLKAYRNLEQKNRIQQVLLEISKIVTSTLDINEVFSSILSIMEKSLKLEKGALSLYIAEEGNLQIKAAIGLSADEILKGVYNPGEGITGKVFETGKPFIVPSVGEEKDFLNRVGYLNYFLQSPSNIGFLAVPVSGENSNIGVLSSFVVMQKNVDLNAYLDFMQVVALIISQAIRIQHLVDEEKLEISRENKLLKRELKDKYQFGSIIGRAKQMEKIFETIQLIADSRASVLITGESGTGKEMIASAIHYNSNRMAKPFIKINCAAIPENLLESELFGHKKGSFTGAYADKKGKFELADGGTIFLDEVGELDFNLQSKLLRVLQEREIEAVGSVKTKKVDIRVIAATNADLEKSISEKKFRSDLYYRLNVVNILTPPLRERAEDIPILINHFIDKYAKENNKQVKGITREAVKILLVYSWPGNVRELENTIERSIVLSQGELLDIRDFEDISSKNSLVILKSSSSSFTEGLPLPMDGSGIDLDALDGHAMETVVNEVESRLIRYALKKFKHTKIQAAKFLGINRNTLDKKIRELNIEE